MIYETLTRDDNIVSPLTFFNLNHLYDIRMETKTSKITRTVFVSEWTNPKGEPVYYHTIDLVNGDSGQIGSKEKMPAKLNPGSELTYTIESTTRGNKIKAVVPNNFKPGGGGRPVADPRASFIGYAASYSKDLVIGGKIQIDNMNAFSDAIFKNMIKQFNEIK